MATEQKNGSPTPTRSLFYPGTKTLKPQFVSALKRIFKLCDRDKDGALSDQEIQKFQLECFKQQMSPSQLVNLKRKIQVKLFEGVNDHGLTLSGFFLMHALIITEGHYTMIWMVLKRFGYSDDIILSTNQITIAIDDTPNEDVKLFSYTLKAVHCPPAPLYDYEAQSLKPRCARALKRIFFFLDHDKDGALSVAEMEALQRNWCEVHLETSEIWRLLRQKLPEGVNDHGITLIGFLYLYASNLQNKHTESTWKLLRKFGYNDDLILRDGYIPVSFKRAPDQIVELTNEAIEFLKRIFYSFDCDFDGTLKPAELEDLFSTAPESPWVKAPYKDATENTGSGGLSLNGFLSEWSLMTFLEPEKSLDNLLYIGYPGDLTSALRITRRRKLDRMTQQSERNVIQCFVIGPKKAGKSALLNSFLGRQFVECYTPTTYERIATNVVVCPNGTTKTLILREIPEERVMPLISCKKSWAACDVVVFVHDSSDEQMWKRAEDMLCDVVRHGERSGGFEVPCLILAAKADVMCPYATIALQDSVGVHSSMCIEKPIRTSTKLGALSNIFRKIINATERPHLNIPETVNRKTHKYYTELASYSLGFLSVAVAVSAGLSYATKNNTWV